MKIKAVLNPEQVILLVFNKLLIIKFIPCSSPWDFGNFQKQCLMKAAETLLSIIQGPPRTGKSTTSANIILILASDEANKTIACAPSNEASDNLATAMHRLIRMYQFRLSVIRVYARSKEFQNTENTSGNNILLKESYSAPYFQYFRTLVVRFFLLTINQYFLFYTKKQKNMRLGMGDKT